MLSHAFFVAAFWRKMVPSGVRSYSWGVSCSLFDGIKMRWCHSSVSWLAPCRLWIQMTSPDQGGQISGFIGFTFVQRREVVCGSFVLCFRTRVFCLYCEFMAAIFRPVLWRPAVAEQTSQYRQRSLGQYCVMWQQYFLPTKLRMFLKLPHQK